MTAHSEDPWPPQGPPLRAVALSITMSFMARIFIGTSGWVYGAWRGLFYPPTLPDAQRLSYFANRFRTTEVNYSFYHVPSTDTYRKWLGLVPPDFVFSLKANRVITHVARLQEVGPPWNDFVRGARQLGHQLGPILLQFPPSFRKDHAVLAAFLEMASRTSVHIRLVFEFRHPSWFVEDTYRLLRRHGCALCIADGPRYPRANEVTADFAYVRFHGHAPREAPWYADEDLRQEAKFIRRLARQGIDTYVYFNNDALAHAPANAARLSELVDERRSAA
jgi:uncharacterized protein YecE (DUF72 family)